MYLFAKAKVAVMKPITALAQKPVPVLFLGAGRALYAADLLHAAGLRKPLFVTGPSLRKLGLPNPLLDLLLARGFAPVVYSDIPSDPTYTVVENGLAICRENACDCIIAFGGGSVLDTAKAIAAAYADKKPPQAFKGMLKVRHMPVPFLAIPTTAGTGSEATLVAVISDPQTHRKTTMIDPKLVPQMAILDASLTVGLPAHITAFTAIDALTHAVEAYVSTYANEETRRYSRLSVKLIYENLERVYRNPADLQGREALLLASFYAGLAFTRTYVGYVHAFAHSIGGQCGVPHGLANAVLLPHVMRAYLPTCTRAFSELADAAGLCLDDAGWGEAARAERFLRSLADLNRAVDIPARLDAFPAERVTQTRTEAFAECHGAYPVPRYFTVAEAETLLQAVCAADGNG